MACILIVGFFLAPGLLYCLFYLYNSIAVSTSIFEWGYSEALDDLSLPIFIETFNEKDTYALFYLVDKNRDYLRRTLPWLDSVKEPRDIETYINTSIQGYKGITMKKYVSLPSPYSSNIYGFYQNKDYKEVVPINFKLTLDSKIVGVISYNRLDRDLRESTIGYWIDEFYQGKGIVTEACKHLINLGFSSLRLQKMRVYCALDNSRSRAIPNKLGFKEIGVEKNREFLYDHYVDHVMYELNKEDWTSMYKNGKKTKDFISKPVSLTDSKIYGESPLY